MKALGYALICAGFLAGALVAVWQVSGVDVARLAIALAVGAAGVALVRWTRYREASHEDKLVADAAVLGDSLGRLVTALAALDRDKEAIGVYGLRHQIDDRLRDDLSTFAEARESIAHRYGLVAYGEIMSHVASGERYLNRVWSASTDGYVDEAFEYLGLAHEQLAAAQTSFRRLGSSWE